MARLHERIPKEQFPEIFRPVVRNFGSRNLIVRLNEAARTAIPRQTNLNQLIPKLELLCYEQNRPKVDEELERLYTLFFEERLGKAQEHFDTLSTVLNENLDQESLPKEEEKLAKVKQSLQGIVALLKESGFEPGEVDTVFRLKAFPEVLKLYWEEFRD